MAYPGGNLRPAVDCNRLMMMMMMTLFSQTRLPFQRPLPQWQRTRPRRRQGNLRPFRPDAEAGPMPEMPQASQESGLSTRTISRAHHDDHWQRVWWTGRRHWWPVAEPWTEVEGGWKHDVSECFCSKILIWKECPLSFLPVILHRDLRFGMGKYSTFTVIMPCDRDCSLIIFICLVFFLTFQKWL